MSEFPALLKICFLAYLILSLEASLLICLQFLSQVGCKFNKIRCKTTDYSTLVFKLYIAYLYNRVILAPAPPTLEQHGEWGGTGHWGFRRRTTSKQNSTLSTNISTGTVFTLIPPSQPTLVQGQYSHSFHPCYQH